MFPAYGGASIVLGMSSFHQFAELCDALAATTRKLEKRALMAAYLKGLPVDDAGWAALYLSGSVFAETDRRVLNVGGSLLSKAVAQLSGADREAMHTAYRRHGDFGAASQDLLHAQAGLVPSLTLAAVEAELAAIAVAQGPAAKLRPLLALLARATPLEAKYLIKLISGDMRTGVKQSLVEEAIAAAYEAEIGAVRRAVMLVGDLPEVVRMAVGGRLGEARMRLFHPLGFMLASPVASVEEALKRFAQEIAAEVLAARAGAPFGVVLDAPLLGAEGGAVIQQEPKLALLEALIEDKYDGIRAQLHFGDVGDPERVGLFSRNREDLSASFSELIEAFAGMGEPVILDGEILAWNAVEGRALPFSALQQRLGRKRVTRQMLEQVPVIFMAFDLLYRGDALLLERPLLERRAQLEEIAAQVSTRARRIEAHGQGSLFVEEERAEFLRLMVAPAVRLQSAGQLDDAYEQARARGNEGVMLKALHSIYQPGRRGLAWLKLKRELATLDVVVTGAEFGNGRRASVLSDYTFAIRDGEELKNVGKAYSGLTDAEIAEFTDFFKAHTLEDFGTFRTVEPLVVLEVAFNNVMRSSRHESGFALRFPRILRIRTDKPVSEIDTLERVEEIYDSQPDRPV
jgi:DNA ligase-1